MKKWLFLSLCVVALIICVCIFFSYPQTKHISSTINGIEYNLDKNDSKVSLINIKIDGTFISFPLGRKRFEGTIAITGKDFSDPNREKQLKINFIKKGNVLISSTMSYARIAFSEPNYQGKFYTHNPMYGQIMISADFKKFSVQEISLDNGWNSSNGLMISGPSNNKVDAKEITDSLMDEAQIKE